MRENLPAMPDDHYMIAGEPHRLYTEQQVREYGVAVAEALACYFERPDTMMYRSEVAAAIRRIAKEKPPA